MADGIGSPRRDMPYDMGGGKSRIRDGQAKGARRTPPLPEKREDDREAALGQQAARQEGGDMLEALARELALTLQAAKRAQAAEHVLRAFRGKEQEGMAALLAGSDPVRGGGLPGVEAQAACLTGDYVGGLLADLEALEGPHLALFRKGVMDEQVALALFALDEPGASPFEGPDQAMEIAQVIRKWQERARKDQEHAGARVRALPGGIVRQSHDPARLRRAGFATWRDAVMPLLDGEKTAASARDGGESTEDYLQGIYRDIVAGVPSHGGPVPPWHAPVAGSTAARGPLERVLHFRDGAAWSRYDKGFGRGSLREALLDGLQKAAGTTALMRVLGPCPQANFEAVYDIVLQALRGRGDHDGMERLHRARRPLMARLGIVDGSSGDGPHPAAVDRTVRALQRLDSLGKAVLPAVTDTPPLAEGAAWQGRSLFLSLLRGMRRMVREHDATGQRRILSALGVFGEVMSGDLAARFGAEAAPGRMTRLQSLFFRASCLSWWTAAWREAAGAMLGHDLALEKELPWDALGKERQHELGLYGIDSRRWDILRSAGTRAADGRTYLTPDALDDVGPEVLAACLVREGLEATEENMARLRSELRSQLRAYFQDRLDGDPLRPDTGPSARAQQASRASIPDGLLRFVMPFRHFPVARLQKVWGGEQGGQDAAWKGFFNQHGEFADLVRLVLMQTVLGYMAMTAREMLDGQAPRDIDSPEAACATFTAAALRGGAMGTFGDLMFGEALRAGPEGRPGGRAGTDDGIRDIWTRIHEGGAPDKDTLRAVMGLVPGQELWWVRGAFGWLLGHQLFELVNPGYDRRLERRMAQENGQAFWMRPQGMAG